MSTMFFLIPSRIDFLYSIKSQDEHDEEAEGDEQEGKVVLLSEYPHRIFISLNQVLNQSYWSICFIKEEQNRKRRRN